MFEPPARVAVPEEAILFSLGATDDPSGFEILEWAWAGAFSESGTRLVIGDRTAPYLRFIDLESGARVATGAEGRGPGELGGVGAVDFLGDSMVVVLSRGRAETFDVEGNWLDGIRLTDAGIRPLSLAVACGTDLFAYGPSHDQGDADTHPWVYAIEVDDGVSATVVLAVEGPRWSGTAGLQGFSGAPEGVLVWHRDGGRPTGYWISCDGSTSTWSAGPSEAPSTGSTGGSVVTLPDTIFAGAAVHGHLKLWAWRALQPADGQPATRWHGVVEDECWEVEIEGIWRILDAHERGLMIATREPFPRVLVLDWDWVLQQRSPAACRAPESSE